LFLDLLLLALELEQLLLRFLHLIIQVLDRRRLLSQVEHLFNRSSSFYHDNLRRRPGSPKRILASLQQIVKPLNR